MKKLREKLDKIYRKYNKAKFIHPDPLEFLPKYSDVRDREIVGIIASSLAYGRVAQILLSIRKVLDVMGESPFRYLKNTTQKKIREDLSGFKYRFTTDENITSLLITLKKIIKEYGDIYTCFKSGYKKSDETLLPSFEKFCEKLESNKFNGGILVPYPSKGSACKKFNLFLRWMVRCDEVDPGGWDFPPSKLIIPLDTHMMQFSTSMGVVQRKQADMKSALIITEWFRSINPEDPIKYDFSLTRFGIRQELTHDELIAHFK